MQDFLFFKIEKLYLKIRFADILYIQAEGRYVAIFTNNQCYFSLISITQIERQLPSDLFRRIHRSYIISLIHTDKFDNEFAFVGNKRIPIAEQYKNVLKSAIVVVHGAAAARMLHNGKVENFLDGINS